MTIHALPPPQPRASQVAFWALVAVAAAAVTGRMGPGRDSVGPVSVRDDDGGRVREAGRGRRARSPRDIPWRGWKDILWRTYAEIGNDRLLAVAAGVVFYALLAIFPALTALVSSYGLFADPATIAEHLSFLANVMPAAAYELIQQQISNLVAAGGGGLTVTFVVGLALAIWSANAGMKAIFDALNVVYDETEKRGFIRLNLVSLAFTAAALVLLLVIVGAVVVLPLVFAWMGLEREGGQLLTLLRWPVLLVLVALTLAVLYRVGPSREKPRWQWLSVGSVFASVAWLAMSLAFSYYLANFADYNATYGSLGAVIGLMMWMWLSTVCVLVGAQINSEIEHQTARDSTEGPPKPRGQRGALMADTVGAAQD